MRYFDQDIKPTTVHYHQTAELHGYHQLNMILLQINTLEKCTKFQLNPHRNINTTTRNIGGNHKVKRLDSEPVQAHLEI